MPRSSTADLVTRVLATRTPFVPSVTPLRVGTVPTTLPAALRSSPTGPAIAGWALTASSPRASQCPRRPSMVGPSVPSGSGLEIRDLGRGHPHQVGGCNLEHRVRGAGGGPH